MKGEDLSVSQKGTHGLWVNLFSRGKEIELFKNQTQN